MNPLDLLRALDRSHYRPGTTCPRCQGQADRSTGFFGDDAPQPGDLAICFDCEAPLEYQPDLSFRLMTDAEVAALDDEVLLSLLDALEAARIMRKAADAVSAPTPSARGRSRAPRA